MVMPIATVALSPQNIPCRWIWLTYPSEKYEFVSWDDYSQYMESPKIHVPNHQPGMFIPQKYGFHGGNLTHSHLGMIEPLNPNQKPCEKPSYS